VEAALSLREDDLLDHGDGMNPHDVLIIVMQPPLGSCCAILERPVAQRPTGPLDEAGILAVVANLSTNGSGTVLVDLGEIDAVTDDDVKALTGFLWSLRVEGAQPAVVCPGRDVVNACRALKLDQAFPLAVSRDEALGMIGEE
jgi:hypothetical protein